MMSFDELLIDPVDRLQLKKFVQQLEQALLLVADKGFGKATVAQELAMLKAAHKQTNILTIKSVDARTISIEQVRAIKQFFALKASNASDALVCIVEDADEMTIEAQNALLKIIEEPPASCYVIMTSANPEALLPTVISRVHQHVLKAPSEKALEQYVVTLGLPTDSVKIAPQLPGLAISLAKNEQSGLVEMIDKAKILLGQSIFERLKSVDSYSKNRSSALELLYALKIISTATLTALVRKNADTNKWQLITTRVLEARRQLEDNVSTKLVMTNLMLNL